MKYFKMNRHSILSKTLWLLLFVALGCSQRGCSCKRVETIKQEIVIADRLGEKGTDKFPADFVNLLYIKNLLYVKDADTLLQRFKPNVTLTRLDANLAVSNVQKLGMNDWQRFIRSIFTLSPDNYDPDLESRFLKNELGHDLSAKSPFTDSLKIASVDQYILNEIQEPQRCKVYFYSANVKNNFYRCKIDLSDTASKRISGHGHTKQQSKKIGKGLGCANGETATDKNYKKITKLDTVFQIFHSIDCINFLIAKNADSITLNGSACSVKDRTVKHIIIFEPPITCTVVADTIKMIGIPAGDTICSNVERKHYGPFRTNIAADSICWEQIKPCPGIAMLPLRWKGDSCVFSMKRENIKAAGELIIKITPYKDSLPSISSDLKLMIRLCDNPKIARKLIRQPEPVKPKIKQGTIAKPNPRNVKNDTGAINQVRRQIINDFRELLFMYAKTQTHTEQKFFRATAINKIREIPDVRVDIIPKNDISTFLDDIATGSSAWALPKVTPILDKKSWLIVGVTIEQK